MSGTRGKKREKEQMGAWGMVLLDMLRGGIVGVGTALVVLGVIAALVSAGLMRQQPGGAMIIGICGAGALIGGIVGAGRWKDTARSVGIGTGLTMFLLLFAAGAVWCGSLPEFKQAGATLGACLCGGGVSGMLMAKPRKRRHR